MMPAHTQDHPAHARKLLVPRPCLLRAKVYMYPYVMVMGSDTSVIRRGCPPITACKDRTLAEAMPLMLSVQASASASASSAGRTAPQLPAQRLPLL